MEYYNNILCISGSELIRTDININGIIPKTTYDKMVQRGRINVIRRSCYGKAALIEIDSLPAKYQQQIYIKYGDPRKIAEVKPFVERIEADTEAAAYFLEYTYIVYDKQLNLPTKHIKEYSNSAAILNEIKIRVQENIKERYRFKNNKNTKFWTKIKDAVKILKETMPHSLPCSEKRLKLTYLEYVKNGYSSLISSKFGNANARRVDTDIELLLNSMFAQLEIKPTVVDVYEYYHNFLKGTVIIINKDTGEQYDASDYPELSKSTIEKYLSKWKNEIQSMPKRTGNRQKLLAKFSPYHSFEQPKFAGSIISVDDRQPPFEYEKGRRMWFYNAIDLGSEAFTCWVYGKTKEGIIMEFYRQIVRNYAEWGFNLPAELEGEMNLNSSFLNTFLQEGSMFQYIHIEANNARGKRIEAYYRPLRYQLEKKREGWLARPFALSEANEAGTYPTKIIPYKELTEGCLRDIETWNNMPHSKIKDKTRWEVFCEMQNPNLRPTNYRAIIPLLGYFTKSHCRAGITKLQQCEFLLGNNGIIATGDNLINLMMQAEGKELQIYWLDGNDGNVLKAYAYNGDRYICELIAKPISQKARIERTPESEANRELMSMYKSTIDGYMSRQVKLLEKLIVEDNTPVTLNNKFQIKGINRYEVKEYGETEVLEDISTSLNDLDEDLIPVSTSFKSSLKDRF